MDFMMSEAFIQVIDKLPRSYNYMLSFGLYCNDRS